MTDEMTDETAMDDGTRQRVDDGDNSTTAGREKTRTSSDEQTKTAHAATRDDG